MTNPFLWLGISILLVAISLMALLTVAILTLQELARAARSAEKLLDTLNQELPRTLQDLRLTGQDLSALSDEVSGSVQSARSVVQQVDQGLVDAKVQAQRAQITGRSLWAGATAALRVLTKPKKRRRLPPRPPASRRGVVPKRQRPGVARQQTDNQVIDNRATDSARSPALPNQQHIAPPAQTQPSLDEHPAPSAHPIDSIEIPSASRRQNNST